MDLENIAGQTLLRLVARGSAIVAELLRLSDHIPSVFLGTDPLEAAKYAGILHDFKYLKTPEIVDEKIDSNPDLLELDEEFRETHMQLLERFYKLFDSILKYHHDYTVYVEELTEGVFVQHTVESVIQDSEGGQLMAEAAYLLGVMLLLMDLRIPGYVRERMVVSFYRYKGAATVPNIDEIVKLCRTTGFGLGPNDKRPPGYPETYFERFAMPRLVIEMIIGRLRSDDVYNRTAAYPAPEHRSTALASQAAMLYVILFFAPSILHTKSAIMREIVDKHFSDNWVVPFYMGHLVDLSDMWEPYKAAKAALSNILERANVQEIMERQVANMARLNEELRKYLTQGVLLEDYVLDNLRKLLHCLRSCNATLRWLMLHRTTTHKKFRELIQKSVDPNQLLMLMLNTAQFESVLKDLFQSLLATKERRWVECQKEASGRMLELSEYFSGEKALTRVARNEKLQNWFRELSGVIDNLSFADPTAAGRKISALNTALQEVEEFHQIETNLQVKQFLGDTRQFLTKMVRTANVLDKTLAEIILIAEFSYSFNIIDDYSQMIHLRIRNNPAIVLLLRATFLKLSSILEAPMVRIVQCESKDSESVAQYFSSSLVLYVRKILDVIPRSVFNQLHEITKLTTSTLRAVPTKLERLMLKDYAQLLDRYELAKATHRVSVFTAGILGMKTTLVGIVQLDPKQLLEDGIRKQLVQQICVAMNEQLVFKTGKLDEFESRVGALGQRLEGLKSSVEYIQDYINLFGLKIWQKELSRIVAYYVEQESNTFLKKQVYDWQSTFQSDAIPIPRFPRIADKANNQHLSENFMGRLVREVLQQTDPRRTVFVESMQGWYDAQNREAIGIRTFDLLNRSVGVFGLTGADRLICFMIVRDLQSFLRQYRKTLDQGLKVFVQKLMHQLHPTSQFPADPAKLYSVALGYTQKMFPVFLEYITKIGQAQLVRRMIANELNFCCKMDSKVLACALEGLNDGLIIDIQAHYSKPESKAYPGDRLLAETTRFLDAAGIADPMTKIYVTTDPLEGVPAMLFLFVLSQIPRLSWDASLCTLVCREKNDPLDGAPFVIGVITVLKQFHSNHTQTFLAYLGQYVRSTISLNASKGTGVFPAEVITVLVFLEEFCRFSKLPRTVIEAYIPSYIFDRFFHAPS